METIDKPESHTRELTKTEVDIAVAQIADRLTRVIKFAEDINRHNDAVPDDVVDDESGPLVGYYNPSSWAVFAAKYDIPDGVHPLFDEALRMDEIKDVSAHIRKWVRGILSPHDCAILVMYADIWNEYDLGWVFLGKPSFNYRGELCVQSENFKQFTEIGSRLYKGNPDDCTIDLCFMGVHFEPTRAVIGRLKASDSKSSIDTKPWSKQSPARRRGLRLPQV